MKRSMYTKALALLMSASVILPFTACKKKNTASETTSRREVVAESDPYFVITEKELALPIDQGRDIERMNISEYSL